MTEPAMRTDDPFAWPFWEGATAGRLLVQRCGACGNHQFYPRPFCLSCEAPDPVWVEVSGRGEVWSITTVHVPVLPGLTPPYQVALVTLEEGPRLLAGIEGPPCGIGDAVRVGWRTRPDAPPLPVFHRMET